eukprot:1158095-Pelagomonas_calceolata.AAC.7
MPSYNMSVHTVRFGICYAHFAVIKTGCYLKALDSKHKLLLPLEQFLMHPKLCAPWSLEKRISFTGFTRGKDDTQYRHAGLLNKDCFLGRVRNDAYEALLGSFSS